MITETAPTGAPVGESTNCRVSDKGNPKTFPHLLHSNLIGVPTSFFASYAFNEEPRQLRINGVREMNASLFKYLDTLDKEKVPLLFMEHMRVMFDLDAPPAPGKKKNFRASYLRLLKGWFFDSNRGEAGVMKGWAESRFGLLPLYHVEPIVGFNDQSYILYLNDKMNGRFHNNAIYSQFDLLYEYSQYYLNRFGPESGLLTLYRGMNLKKEENFAVVERKAKNLLVVRNNSLVSYSTNIERASEFGDAVLEVHVPFPKVLCFPEMLPGNLPVYEGEYILIGGDYLSKITEVL